MSSLFFWNTWPVAHKRLFQILLILLGITVVVYLFGYFYGARLIIQWETISKVSAIPLILDTWEFASIPLNISVDQYVITQVFEGSDLELVTWPSVLLLMILAVCLVVGLAMAVDLSLFWFLTSQVILIFILAGFQLEQLMLFGRTDKVALVLAFLLYLPPGYYFHSVGNKKKLVTRLSVFALVTGLFAVIIHFFSEVHHPFSYLANYGITVPFILSVVFILFTGHEIIYGFLVLITRSNTPTSSNSFVHFFALSLIYLINVLLLYLRNSRRIDWDFYYLDAFWILIAAAATGLWSLRKRRGLFRNIMPAEPHAVTGYLALAIITCITIGYFFATANDPAIEALEDIIVFSQLSIGFVFLLYILFNFRTVLIENLKVHKVVYKPKKMPFFTMRLGGFIGVLGLFLLSNQYPLDQAITAYYNGIGDLHRLDRQPLLAKEYYKLAGVYARTNHRSNYAIASMEREDNDLSEALAYYKQSTLKQPTPFAFVNTARSYDEQGMFFKAMFTLKDGLEAFPGEPHISNNLSALYAKTDLLDSAYFFLSNLTGDKEVKKVAQTNQMALLTKSRLQLSLDSIYQDISHRYSEVGNNLIVMANSQKVELMQALNFPADSILNPITFAWWYNFNLNKRHNYDSLQIEKLITWGEIPQNDLYRDNLEFAVILRTYYSGNKAQAFQLLNSLQFRATGKAGLYNDILGQWSLQQEQPGLALDFFDQSIRAGYLPAMWHRSLALVAMGQIREAHDSWRQLESRNSGNLEVDLSPLLNFVSGHNMQWDSLTNRQKMWFLHFKAGEWPLLEKCQLSVEITDPEIYHRVEQRLWEQALKEGATDALKWMIKKNNQPIRELQLAVIENDLNRLSQILGEFETSDPGLQPWILYGQALLSEKQGNEKQAAAKYQWLTRDPFFEQGILAAVRYFNRIDEDDFKAYDLLLEAILVNKYSVRLLKAYGKQCTMLNLDTYKQTTLETLESLVNEAEYDKYLLELALLEQSAVDGFEQPDLDEDQR
ncbi:MAG: hypothetical protein DHS20C17_04840 [Cyclobacteriaceae bacterium]|nr:MAG: hypothetical protein DHS20C17_04840 [Cyclobacteriaceae bacterium]